MEPRGVILWDFDYTLGFRGALAENENRLPWATCLIEVLDLYEPGHTVDIQDIRPHLRDGFPWHQHADPHPELCDADDWWQNAELVFARAFGQVGIEASRIAEMAGRVRHVFADSKAWSLFPDTLPTLRALRKTGWRHLIVSNHVPELEQIVRDLGIGQLIDHVVCSAVTGYEKPHPEAFEIARRLAGSPEKIWMIGDNPVADVQGAESVGMPAIQVRTRRAESIHHYAEDLLGVPDIVST